MERELAAAYLEGDVTVRIGTAETQGFTDHQDATVYDRDTGMATTERRRTFLVPAGVFEDLVYGAEVIVTDRASGAVTYWQYRERIEEAPDGAELRLVVVPKN